MTNATAEDDRTRGRLGRPGLPRRCASLGIDVAADRVSIVATSKGNFGLEIARAADAPTLESPLRALETLLRSLAKEERIVERRCVVAIRPGAAEIAYKAFPRKFPPSEIAAAAKTLMNGAAAFSRERIVRTIKLSTVEPDGNVHYGIVAANRAQVDEAALLPRR